MRQCVAVLAMALASTALWPAVASAGGFFLTERGARPLSRGFAFVAGADDASAIWHNPAGLADVGRSLFMDFTLSNMYGDFTRINSGGEVLPSVEIDHTLLPIPMIAWTDNFGLEDFTFGIAGIAPNGLQLQWPTGVTSIDGEAEPAPQRYSLLTMEGSVFAVGALSAAWTPIRGLSVGASLNAILGGFRIRVNISACDQVLCSQPENPEYDAEVEMHQSSTFELNARFGIRYTVGRLRIGAMFSTPYTIGGEAKIRVRLPDASIFRGARVDGDTIELGLPFPWVASLGIELSPTPDLRIEAAAVYEAWSRQSEVSVTPQNVWIRNASAVGDYQVGPLNIQRQMSDVLSLRVGGEYAIPDSPFRLAAGVCYENSSFKDAYLTPLTLDSDKLVVGLGMSIRVNPEWEVTVSYGHVFMRDRDVRNSAVTQSNPIRPPGAESDPAPFGPVYLGNGAYRMEADIFGIGLEWRPAVTQE
jgi:long-chain fatty acid transport protein